MTRNSDLFERYCRAEAAARAALWRWGHANGPRSKEKALEAADKHKERADILRDKIRAAIAKAEGAE